MYINKVDNSLGDGLDDVLDEDDLKDENEGATGGIDRYELYF